MALVVDGSFSFSRVFNHVNVLVLFHFFLIISCFYMMSYYATTRKKITKHNFLFKFTFYSFDFPFSK